LLPQKPVSMQGVNRVLPESHASKRQKKIKKKVNLKESGEGAAKLHVVI